MSSQISPSKGLLNKVRFMEWLSRREDLSLQDIRLAIALVSLTDIKRGFAWPSLDQLATGLNRKKSAVHRQTLRLECLGLFEINRPKRPGRGTANEYRPCFEAIPEGNLYEWKKVTSGEERVTSQVRKGHAIPCTHPGNTSPEEIYIRSSTDGASSDAPISEEVKLKRESYLLFEAEAYAEELAKAWADPSLVSEIAYDAKDLSMRARDAGDKKAAQKAAAVAVKADQRFEELQQ